MGYEIDWQRGMIGGGHFMELLQKITLYDILGYTFPGCTLLYIWNYSEIGKAKQDSFFFIGMFLVLGYLLGIVISEAGTVLCDSLEGTFNKDLSKMEKTPLDVIEKAFLKAGLISVTYTGFSWEVVKERFPEIYADIQADKNYSRIHNYASAELLYKNMAFVSLICGIKYAVEGEKSALFICIVSCVLFFRRWRRFYEKKNSYCLAWFIQKYCCEQEKCVLK